MTKNVTYEKDYQKKLRDPGNEKRLNELRFAVIEKLFDVGYDVILEKVLAMLDTWLDWQEKQKADYITSETFLLGAIHELWQLGELAPPVQKKLFTVIYMLWSRQAERQVQP